jgi:hypothetical protein
MCGSGRLLPPPLQGHVGSVVQEGGPIPPGTPIGRLGDTEWSWVVAAVIFAWIRTRAEQATSQEIDTEQAIRLTGYSVEPWDAGAVATILPRLADTPGVDWSKPLADWPREEMTHFLTVAFGLIRQAMIARDFGGGSITRARKEESDVLDDPVGL